MNKHKRTRFRRDRRPRHFELEMPTKRLDGKGHYRYVVPRTVQVKAKRVI